MNNYKQEIKQAESDRDYWKQFERGQWRLYGFTGRDSAYFIHQKTQRDIRVTSDYLDLLTTDQ